MKMLSTEDAQRVAVCQVGPLHYMLVASANDRGNTGLTLREFADFLVSKGVQFAYNLDGGGSSTMVFNGAVVNVPTGGHGVKERAVTDAVCIV